MPVLHVVVPVYNERDTLAQCLRRVLAAPLPPPWTADLYVVDDHSGDGAFEDAQALVRSLQEDGRAVALLRHDENLGKGASLRTGFDAILAAGADDSDLVVVQDADLEYDPRDLPALMAPILAGRAGAVVGNRWGGHRPPGGLKRRVHAWGNAALTALSNGLTGYRLRDMECCYKMMRVELLRKLRPLLTERRFGIEPQIVAALARLGERVEQVPVSYDPRSVSAGKKIGWRDGVRAVVVIARERARSGPGGAP